MIGPSLRAVITDLSPSSGSDLMRFYETYFFFEPGIADYSTSQQLLRAFAQVMAYQYMLRAQNDPENRVKWIHYCRFWEKGIEKFY